MNAAAIAESIETSWRNWLDASRRPATPHAHVYASAWRACDRRMALELTQPEALPPWPVEVLAKFRRGDDRERDLLADLTRIGRDADPPFGVLAQQERFVLRDLKQRVAIVGKVDARLAVADQRLPIEVKAWSPFVVDRLDRFEQVFDSPWTQAGGYQLLSYLYGAGEPFGFLLLDRSGLPKLLPVELEPHLDRMEAFLRKAERVLDHVAASTLPAYLADDPAECRRCPFYGSTCNPPLTADVATILSDPELEAVLERREALKAAATEFRELDDVAKTALRGVTAGIAGKFAIRGTWGKTSRLEVPEALKAQYTVSNPRGRFSLEITRLA